ncbi:hypothetical protein ACFC1T_08870 [Kitasatospora sp. NPDC056076]|uniref:hypothetical protein n=1 Tax=Kitasatospora sp. NPDC056076 TaxID=3345703 RepID=UPI0035E0BDD2
MTTIDHTDPAINELARVVLALAHRCAANAEAAAEHIGHRLLSTTPLPSDDIEHYQNTARELAIWRRLEAFDPRLADNPAPLLRKLVRFHNGEISMPDILLGPDAEPGDADRARDAFAALTDFVTVLCDN